MAFDRLQNHVQVLYMAYLRQGKQSPGVLKAHCFTFWLQQNSAKQWTIKDMEVNL
jgi:hypothetical protein